MDRDIKNLILKNKETNESLLEKRRNINDLSFLLSEENYLYIKDIDNENNFIRSKILNYICNIMSNIDKVTFIDRRNLEFITRYLEQELSNELFNKIKDNYVSIGKDENISQEEISFRILKKSYDLIKDTLFNQLKSLNIDKNDIKKRIETIRNTFRLSDNEVEILIYEYIYQEDNNFLNFIESNSSKQNFNGFCITSCKSLSTMLNIKICEVKFVYSKQSNLTKCNLLSNNTNIAPEIIDYINGFSEEPLIDNYFYEIKGKFLNPEDFSINNEDIEIIYNLLKNNNSDKGMKILLYGDPGTGKTEFARAVSKSTVKKVFELKMNNNKEKEEDKNFKFRALSAYENYINTGESILIIDEADEALSTNRNIFGSYNDNMKGKINQYLDESITYQIWITNSVSGMDDSTKRRFDYCLEFNELTEKQRIKIWNNILNEYNLNNFISENEIRIIAEKYDCNAGNIRNSVRNFIAIYKNEFETEKFKKIIDKSLSSYIKLVKEGDFSEKYRNNIVAENYSTEGLNIKGNLDEYLEMIDKFDKLWEENDNKIRNMNILLFGPPGTGKTEFVKYIAKRLKRKLSIKNPSDILSKWVGGTEANLAGAFRKTENENGILFIDEADSILRSRDKAEHSWESTQVNELLMRMENFRGIFISATNRFYDLDPAVIRRFNFKIEFEYLDFDRICKLSEIYFSEFLNGNINEEERKKLKNIKNLTPGDFKTVYQKLNYINKDQIDYNLIYNLLNEESIMKNNFLNKNIGFKTRD